MSTAETTIEIPPRAAHKVQRSLYTIGEDLSALDDLLLEIGGDLSEAEVEAAINEFFTELGADLERKLQDYARLILEKTARGKALREESKRLAEAAAVEENGTKRMKSRLLEFMEARGESNLIAGLHKFTICNNGGLAHLTVLVPADELPRELQKIEPDNEAIRSALESGKTGIEELARLEARGKHVRVS